MTYQGKVRNGLVVLNDSVTLPEGSVVSVQVLGPDLEDDDQAAITRLGDLGIEAGLPDLATNIDDYLHCHPKPVLAPYEVVAGSTGWMDEESGPLARAWLSLEGLSIGDAFGERFFIHPEQVEAVIPARTLPGPPWE